MKFFLRGLPALLLLALLSVAACGPTSGSKVDAQSQVTATAPAPPVDDQPATPRKPVKLLADAIGTHKLVLLGELHGTRETPALVADLVEYLARNGRQVVLALEITSADQPVVDRYMASGDDPTDSAALLAGSHWQETMHDGRDSRAMFEMIQRMRQLSDAGADVSIDLFDEAGDGERNKRMAEHLRGVVRDASQATVLVLTGNVHAMTAEPPWKMFEGGKQIKPPMTAGRYLADLHPLSINIDAASGQAWNCSGHDCAANPVLDRGRQDQAVLVFSESTESAWNAILTMPEFTASPPAVSAPTK